MAASQGDIGGSSNLAQLALSYSYSYLDKKFTDYVCILSVIAQAAIDNMTVIKEIVVPKKLVNLVVKPK